MIKSICIIFIFLNALSLKCEDFELPTNSSIKYLDTLKLDIKENNKQGDNDIEIILTFLYFCMLEDNDRKLLSSFEENITSYYIYNCIFEINNQNYEISLIKVEYSDFTGQEILSDRFQDDMKLCIDVEKLLFGYIPLKTEVSNTIYFLRYNKTKYSYFSKYFWKY